MKTYLRRTIASACGAVALLFAAVPVLAHEAPCAFCKLPVVQDTATQDNETAIRYGRKRIEYRCVYCALADSQTATYQTGDLTLLAPSEKKGLPIPITRTAGKWSAPEGTVFLGVGKIDHKTCALTFRAFTSKTALDTYKKANAAKLSPDAKPVTLTELLALTKGGAK